MHKIIKNSVLILLICIAFVSCKKNNDKIENDTEYTLESNFLIKPDGTIFNSKSILNLETYPSILFGDESLITLKDVKLLISNYSGPIHQKIIDADMFVSDTAETGKQKICTINNLYLDSLVNKEQTLTFEPGGADRLVQLICNSSHNAGLHIIGHIGPLSGNSFNVSVKFNLSRKSKTIIWRISGHVYDSNNNPVQGATVYFADSKAQWIRNAGTSTTNETGYYSITLDEKVVGSFGNLSYYLYVSNKYKEIVYRGSNIIQPIRGIIEHQDVILY